MNPHLTVIKLRIIAAAEKAVFSSLLCRSVCGITLGTPDDLNNYSRILQFAFDNGHNHFDLANNYGPPLRSAEINFGKL